MISPIGRAAVRSPLRSITTRKISTGMQLRAADDDDTSRKKKEECEKLKSASACLKPSGLIRKEGGASTKKKPCDRLCLPCCKPARDPPDCYYPQAKITCNRVPTPWPSFSECKDAMSHQKSKPPCECLLPPLPPCDRKGDKNAKGCRKAEN